MRVLVVEDEVRTAELLRRGLTEEGYAVDVAADGPDAVWQAREVVYDLIVLVSAYTGMCIGQYRKMHSLEEMPPVM
ncbi:hypothetical protein [Streptomyces sp. NPDC056713]|uniref:hypothetical protein n=1 Tax=Streptomyces sp. NPDC056713 TaxID=3345921 RepID=UPI0036AB2D9D